MAGFRDGLPGGQAGDLLKGRVLGVGMGTRLQLGCSERPLGASLAWSSGSGSAGG